MTWTATHHRAEVLRLVIAAANSRRDGILPTDVPGVDETFTDDLDLVAALQLRWHTRLAGRIERALDEDPSDLEAAVLRAWRETADELVGVRAVLDAGAAAPSSPAMERALQVSQRKEHALLAVMAGHGSTSASATQHVGRQLEDRARSLHDPRQAPQRGTRPDGGQPGGGGRTLMHRLRAHLAA